METFYYKSPLGALKIDILDQHITRIDFSKTFKPLKPSSSFAKKAFREIDEYFKGTRTRFSVPFKYEGTEFQKEVWKALSTVGFSKTVSYQDIAKKIKRPKAVRAVGTACGRNPITIIVPCHRIVGSNGKLTGYAGGLDKKEWLLSHEKSAVS